VDFRLSRKVKLPPDIVDPDHDRQPIRLQVEDIGLPPAFQLPHRVAAAALIHHTDAERRVRRCKQRIHQGDISLASGAEQPLANRSGPLRVSNGIADHDQLAAFLDLHDTVLSPAGIVTRKSSTSRRSDAENCPEITLQKALSERLITMHLTFLDIFDLAVPLAILQAAFMFGLKKYLENSIRQECKRECDAALSVSKQASAPADQPADNHGAVRIEHLLDAYRKLEAAALREDLSPYEDGVEAAIAEIQLLGTVTQANLAAGFAQALATTRRGDLTKLLQDLRDDLRKEFSLQPVSGKPVHLRITQKAVL